MGVIPNPKMAFIFSISCILALIFPILIKYFPKCVGKGSFPNSQIKSLLLHKDMLSLENFGKTLRKVHFCNTIIARKSRKDSYVLKALVPEQRLTSY